MTSGYSGFQPKKHDGSPGKPREATRFAMNVTQFYITGTEGWCSRYSKRAFKTPARKSRLASLFEHGGFSPTWTIPEIPHSTTGTKERQRLHRDNPPDIVQPLSLPPFPSKYEPPPLPPSAKRRRRLQRGNERWRLERYSATSFLEGGDFAGGVDSLSFLKEVPKRPLRLFFLFEIWLILELEKKTKLFGEINYRNHETLQFGKLLVFVSDFGDAENSSDTATTGQLLHLAKQWLFKFLELHHGTHKWWFRRWTSFSSQVIFRFHARNPYWIRVVNSEYLEHWVHQ